MLHEDLTTGAILVGWTVGTDGKLTAAQAREIRDAVRDANSKHGTNVTFFVPGDSATNHLGNLDAELYAWDIILGIPALMAQTWDCPAEVTADNVARARSRVEEIPAGFWEDIASSSEIFDDFKPGEPQTFLTCCGPLPAVALSAGVRHPSDAREDTVYKFHSVQDMDQMWLDEGVDGVSIAWCEFTDVKTLDLSQDAIDGWLAKASDLEDPKILMTLRYD